MTNFRPLSQCLALTVNHYDSTASCIVGLFFGSSPSAIFFAIMAVVIFSLYTVFWTWPIAHVFVKSFKRFPVWINLNTPCSIFIVARIIFVSASLFHTRPNTIFGSFGFSMCFASYSYGVSTAQASAGFCIPGTQRYLVNSSFVSAVTPTEPVSIFSVASFLLFDNNKFTEPLAYQIKQTAARFCASISQIFDLYILNCTAVTLATISSATALSFAFAKNCPFVEFLSDLKINWFSHFQWPFVIKQLIGCSKNEFVPLLAPIFVCANRQEYVL